LKVAVSYEPKKKLKKFSLASKNNHTTLSEMLSSRIYNSIIRNTRLLLIKFTFKKLLPFSINYNTSTSGNLKGEKNADFDNFMMIAYI
jgi:hypothetical protein